MAATQTKPVHRKIKAVGLTGAVATVLVAVFQRLHIVLTPVEATAAATIILTGAGYATHS